MTQITPPKESKDYGNYMFAALASTVGAGLFALNAYFTPATVIEANACVSDPVVSSDAKPACPAP